MMWGYGMEWWMWLVMGSGALAFWLVIVLFAHPFFAVVAPSGGEVLVVEGWMHDEGLKEAADLFKEMGAAVTIMGGGPIVPAMDRGRNRH